jgi:hypothetical protein
VAYTTTADIEAMSTPEPTSGCWLWTGSYGGGGYGNAKVAGKGMNSSRAMWTVTFGDPGKLHVLHKCDNRACVNPDHLFLGTNQDNQIDCVRKGRKVALVGQSNGNSKLTDDQANEIRCRYAMGYRSSPKLGREYGVSFMTVLRIVHGVRRAA